MQIPLDYLDWQTSWTVKTTKSPTGDTIARIETPQKTFEARHADRAFAVSKVTAEVTQAMRQGQVIPTSSRGGIPPVGAISKPGASTS